MDSWYHLFLKYCSILEANLTRLETFKCIFWIGQILIFGIFSVNFSLFYSFGSHFGHLWFLGAFEYFGLVKFIYVAAYSYFTISYFISSWAFRSDYEDSNDLIFENDDKLDRFLVCFLIGCCYCQLLFSLFSIWKISSAT